MSKLAKIGSLYPLMRSVAIGGVFLSIGVATTIPLDDSTRITMFWTLMGICGFGILTAICSELTQKKEKEKDFEKGR